jgi:hypothetical protein
VWTDVSLSIADLNGTVIWLIGLYMFAGTVLLDMYKILQPILLGITIVR